MFGTFTRFMAIAVIGFAVVAIVTAPNANAQPFDKKTIIDVNQPFQIPGVTLPAGTYVMKLVDVAGSRTVVRFLNSEENTVYATILGIPDYRLEPTDKSAFSFYEAKPEAARALRSWFYPGATYGVEFVYPKAKAEEIAAASGEHVIATAELAPAEEETVQNLEQESIFAVEPDGRAAAIAEVHPETPVLAETPAVSPPAAPAVPELPRTATPLALIGLTGILAGGMATGLRIVRRRK
jgi:hypothetical protein